MTPDQAFILAHFAPLLWAFLVGCVVVAVLPLRPKRGEAGE
jgi:hypothetical protein